MLAFAILCWTPWGSVGQSLAHVLGDDKVTVVTAIRLGFRVEAKSTTYGIVIGTKATKVRVVVGRFGACGR
jgi:hypothetical protein